MSMDRSDSTSTCRMPPSLLQDVEVLRPVAAVLGQSVVIRGLVVVVLPQAVALPPPWLVVLWG